LLIGRVDGVLKKIGRNGSVPLSIAKPLTAVNP
jgi:hypothetical protein